MMAQRQPTQQVIVEAKFCAREKRGETEKQRILGA
jgi:hypothetical protein